jgi:hypothetical protein
MQVNKDLLQVTGEVSPQQLIAGIRPLTDRLVWDYFWLRDSEGSPKTQKRRLTDRDLVAHFTSSASVGMAFIQPGTGVVRAAAIDFDDHDRANPITAQEKVARVQAVLAAGAKRGLRFNVFRSGGGRGFHAVCIWQEAQCAHSVRVLLRAVLASCGLEEGPRGLAAAEAEIFPKADSVEPGRFGSMLWLPGCRRSVPLMGTSLEPGAKSDLAALQWPVSDPVPVVVPPARQPQEWELAVLDDAALAAVLERLESALAFVPNDESVDYETYIRAIWAIKHETGGAPQGEDLAQRWSEQNPKHTDAVFTEKIWNWASDDKARVVTGEFLYRKARAAGWLDAELINEFPIIQGDDVTTARSQGRYPVLTAAEVVALPPVRWRVRGVLPTEGLFALYGPPGSGKSFLGLDMLAAIASGQEWFGLRVRQGPTAYVALEGEQGIAQRVMAYQAIHGGVPAEMRFVAKPFSLMQESDIRDLAAALRGAGCAQGVVLLDTLNRASAGVDENDSAGMGMLIAAAKRLQSALGGAVGVVHHTGKDPTKGLRGHSSLGGAIDASVEVIRNGAHREWRTGKVKDGDDDNVYPFFLQRVPLGVDEDGDSVSSCVIARTTVGGGTPTQAEGPWEKTARELRPAIEDVLRRVPEGLSRNALVGALRERGVKIGNGTDAVVLRELEQQGAIVRTEGKNKTNLYSLPAQTATGVSE